MSSVLYRKTCAFLDKFVPAKLEPAWNHHGGPKTIFFWAPVVKGGLVIAGLGDLSRPADTISLSQSLSLALTGLIWARYSVVIVPKNYGLTVVNLFLAGTQLLQAFRAISYQRQQEKLQQENPKISMITT